MTDTLPGVRTRQLIEEMRRDGERRDREAREREDHRQASLAEMRREAQERHKEHLAFMRRQSAFIQESRDVRREMLAELRDHGERMRLGFDATYGALIDLRQEIQSWRDDGGSSATA